MADFRIGGRFGQVDGKVNHGNVQGRHAHRHTGQFAVEFRNYFTYGFGSTGRRRDDVAGSGTAASPILHRRTVNRFLGGGGGVHGGHQTIFNTELVVQNFGNRSQAVRGAGSVGNELGTFYIGFFVYADYEHRGSVFGRSRHYHIFGAGFNVGLRFFLGKEQTGGFYYIFGTYFIPSQFFGVLASGYADFFAVDDQLAVFNVRFHGAVKFAVHRIIFEHISQIVNRAQVVDAYDFNIFAFLRRAEYKATDAAKTVNTNFNHTVYTLHRFFTSANILLFFEPFVYPVNRVN